MIVENMYQAKTHLSKLVEKALNGEDVVLAKAGKPMVRLVPYDDKPEALKLGLMAGKIHIPDDFNSLTPELEEMFKDYL